MPGHALSDHQKKKIDQDLIKECVGKAVEVYCQELLKGPEMCSGLRVISEYHGINKDTLTQAVHHHRALILLIKLSRNFLKSKKISLSILFQILPIEGSPSHIGHQSILNAILANRNRNNL